MDSSKLKWFTSDGADEHLLELYHSNESRI
jgi:hypothetical protein